MGVYRQSRYDVPLTGSVNYIAALRRIYGEDAIELHIILKPQSIVRITVDWSLGGDHMINLLPSKPDATTYAPDVIVKKEVQDFVNDWVQRVDSRNRKGQLICLNQKVLFELEPRVLEKALIYCPYLTKMYVLFEFGCILCATDATLISFPLLGTVWRNIDAYYAFDFNDGLIVMEPDFSLKAAASSLDAYNKKWKENNYVGDMIPEYVGISEEQLKTIQEWKCSSEKKEVEKNGEDPQVEK